MPCIKRIHSICIKAFLRPPSRHAAAPDHRLYEIVAWVRGENWQERRSNDSQRTPSRPKSRTARNHADRVVNGPSNIDTVARCNQLLESR